MKINDLKIMVKLKINLDQAMQTTHIVKNMDSEIIEEQEDRPLERQPQELQLGLLQEK